jgi:hypothetical protein
MGSVELIITFVAFVPISLDIEITSAPRTSTKMKRVFNTAIHKSDSPVRR